MADTSSEGFFAALAGASADAIVVIGGDGTIHYANPAAGRLLGAGSAGGARLPDLVPEASRAEVTRAVAQLLGSPGTAPGDAEPWQLHGSDGTVTHLQVTCSDLRSHPAVAGLALTLRDVTGQRALEAELEHQALHDELTGLPRRALLTDRAGHAVARAGRPGSPEAAILFVDLDDFKEVNDTYGHAVGDELLVQAAGRLEGAVRVSDTVARVGGDEFAIVIEDLSDPGAATLSASRVVEAFRHPFTLTAGEVTVTVSVGIATTADGGRAEDVLRRADIAMYAAKKAAKSTWCAYEPGMSDTGAAAQGTSAAIDALTGQSFPGPCQPRPPGTPVAGDQAAGRPLAARAAEGPARPARATR